MAGAMAGANRRPNPIAEAIDRQPVGFWQIVLVLGLLIAMVLDGYDVKLLSYAAPLIIEEWSLSSQEFAPPLAAAMMGMAIGSAIGGWLGDQIGRRVVIVWAVILFGVMTMLSAFATDTTTLTIYRLIAGCGFGGVLPNAYAMVVEWLPRRVQSRVIAVLAVATPTGGMIGAAITLFLLPVYGWRGCFIIVGAVTVLFGLLMLFWLPESVTYSFLKGRPDRVRRDWRKLMGDAELEIDAAAAQRVERAEKPKVSFRSLLAIFTRDLFRLNIGVALLALAGTFAVYIFGVWVPVILTGAGLAIGEAIQGSFVLNLFAVVCGLWSGELVRRFGTRLMYLIWFGLMLASIGVIALLLITGQATTLAGKFLLLGAMGAYGGGGGGFVSAVSANLAAAYPLHVRATGIGFGVTFARLGMISAAYVGGSMLGIRGDDPAALFMTAGIALGISLISAFIIDRHIPARSGGDEVTGGKDKERSGAPVATDDPAAASPSW